MGLGSLIWTLIIGLVVGAIARLLIPGKEPIASGALGWLITAVIGIVGSFLGTWLAFWRGADYRAGWIMSIVGAVILLLIYRFIANKMSTASNT